MGGQEFANVLLELKYDCARQRVSADGWTEPPSVHIDQQRIFIRTVSTAIKPAPFVLAWGTNSLGEPSLDWSSYILVQAKDVDAFMFGYAFVDLAESRSKGTVKMNVCFGSLNGITLSCSIH